MIRIFLFLFLSSALISCGARIDGLSESVVDEIVEEGDVSDKPEEEVSLGLQNACDLFDENSHEHAALFKEVLPKIEIKCDSVSENEEFSLFVSQKFMQQLLSGYDAEAHRHCPALAKRALRKVRVSVKRSQREDKADDYIFQERNKLTQKRLRRIARKLEHRGCVSNFSFPETLVHNEKQFDFINDENYLLNSEFSVFKETKGLTRLEDGWIIKNSTQIPGWKVTATQANAEGIDCSYLEFQSSGVVTDSNDGHIVELDGHCKNSQGQSVPGNATVEISQRVHLAKVGSYRLIVSAQKRQGIYGDLETAIYKKKKDKNFVQHSLNSSTNWQDICIDYVATEDSGPITVAIKDGNTTDRKTYGLLIDSVKFEEGSCPQN